MHKSESIDELVNKLISLIPEGARTLPEDLKAHFKSVLQSAFKKLDLVTREEFDTQVKVLRRTRAKVDELEKQLAEHNAKPKKTSPRKNKPVDKE
ncbi:MAG: hypothetical protein K0Q74_754 [Gammaproteobacteria bacterium]|nr:hypothetical protein [Gammaproteobacteria bacterium]